MSRSLHEELSALMSTLDAVNVRLGMGHPTPSRALGQTHRAALTPPSLEWPHPATSLAELRASVLHHAASPSFLHATWRAPQPVPTAAAPLAAATHRSEAATRAPLLTLLRPIGVGSEESTAAHAAAVNAQLGEMLVQGGGHGALCAAFALPVEGAELRTMHAAGGGVARAPARFLHRLRNGEWGSLSLRVSVDGSALDVTHDSTSKPGGGAAGVDGWCDAPRPLSQLARVAPGDTRRSLLLYWRVDGGVPRPHDHAAGDGLGDDVMELVAPDEAQRSEWLHALPLLVLLHRNLRAR